ncbi:hypothetical protein ASG78_04325 [Nostocoides sp. Soil756]|nr:hypothetical protein ASG78_04325 [Tetrasphaera sp. Soil756]
MRGRATTIYLERGSWARDSLTCVRCRSIPRERCLATVLSRLRPNWRELALHESSPGAAGLSRALRRACPRYTSSQYLPDTPLGAESSGVRSEDLRALTFPDESLDVLITQDVLEHVFEPERVLAETRRVLGPGGVHVATFPWRPDLPQTRDRAVERDGEVVHLLEPEWHGNPVGDGRSLVTVDWGADVFAIAGRAGLDLTVLKVPYQRRHGIDGEFREVFVFERI